MATPKDYPLLVSVFALGETWFGVEALRIQEITVAGQVTAVRRAPPEVLGIINLRGKIVTVIDPALRMGLDPFEPSRASRVLISESGDEPIGLMVSRVLDVFSVTEDQLSAAPPNLRQTLGRFIGQVFRHEDHLVSLLDMDALLEVDDR